MSPTGWPMQSRLSSSIAAITGLVDIGVVASPQPTTPSLVIFTSTQFFHGLPTTKASRRSIFTVAFLPTSSVIEIDNLRTKCQWCSAIDQTNLPAAIVLIERCRHGQGQDD